MTYSEAASFCADNNAYLAEITSQDDLHFYRDIMTQVGFVSFQIFYACMKRGFYVKPL